MQRILAAQYIELSPFKMHFFTKTLMHTIKHIRYLCHYAIKACSDGIKHLYEPSFTSVSNSLKLAVCIHV